MSNMTHIFRLVDSARHHLISADPNLIITSQGAPDEENHYMASKWGASNHVVGFETGVDKIEVPLALIRELNASTAIVEGALLAERFEASATDPTTTDAVHYNTATGVLAYHDGTDAAALLTLDAAPALAASDIEII